MGSIENTTGVWDRVIPYVLGSPMPITNVFSVRMHAMRILKDKSTVNIDALEPSGSGNMYVGLNEEKATLSEVTKMGFAPKADKSTRSCIKLLIPQILHRIHHGSFDCLKTHCD